VTVAEPVRDIRTATWLVPAIDRAALRAGTLAFRTPAVAIAMWGLVSGVAMSRSGLGVGWALLMTAVVFAGSAQLAVLPLLAVGAPLPVVWVTATLVNLRFVIFSAAARAHFAHLPLRQRLFAGYLNGDVPFAMFAARFAADSNVGTPAQHGFYFGMVGVNWVVWQASSVVGILAAGLAPDSWGLDLAAVLALVAVVVPMIVGRAVTVGVVTAASVAVLTHRWPMRLGLLLAVSAGLTLATLVDARWPARTPSRRSDPEEGR
jgi:predicted branched-subunit amino acid permease